MTPKAAAEGSPALCDFLAAEEQLAVFIGDILRELVRGNAGRLKPVPAPFLARVTDTLHGDSVRCGAAGWTVRLREEKKGKIYQKFNEGIIY